MEGCVFLFEACYNCSASHCLRDTSTSCFLQAVPQQKLASSLKCWNFVFHAVPVLLVFKCLNVFFFLWHNDLGVLFIPSFMSSVIFLAPTFYVKFITVKKKIIKLYISKIRLIISRLRISCSRQLVFSLSGFCSKLAMIGPFPILCDLTNSDMLSKSIYPL